MSIEVWANEGLCGRRQEGEWKEMLAGSMGGGGYWINQVKTGEKNKSSFLFTKEKVKV